ncbi:MAG: FAD-dependent oxidoreductase [Ruminococcaceae bacterium]|nr:FAD-dependent oxidoreductase [Oscillospiraceae bacterium]
MRQIHKDITVIGGGVAGICAAVAAARKGVSVALVHNRPVLGGNASSEIGVFINGAASYNASVYARESGIVGELVNKVLNTSFLYDSKALLDAAFFEFVYAEKNIELFLNTHVTEVEALDNNIKSVDAVQLGSENTFKFISPIFIDCSGDGSVAFAAGAEYMQGREGKDTFGESLAPDEADDYTQGGTLFWSSRKMDHPVKYTRPSFAYDIEKMPFRDNIGRKEQHRVVGNNGLSTLWWMEYGGQCDTVHDNEEITNELRRLVYGFWDYVKNSGKFKGTENYMLESVAPIVGKRESRRFKGDYILTQSDIYDKPDFPDAVTTGGWVVDCHAPFGIYDEGKASNWVPHRGTYNIPYRCLYSVNINNLFFGGRIISTSHVAHGSTRVIATGAAAAEVSGTAAYLCVKNGVSPRDVNFDELHELLVRDDKYIMGKKEGINHELIPKISASSVSEYENTQLTSLFDLAEKHYLALPSLTDKLDSVDVYVKNNADTETTLFYNVYTGRLTESYLPTVLLQKKELTLPAGFEGYMTFALDAKGIKDKKAYVEFLKNDDVALGISDFALTGSPSFEYNDDETMGIYIDGVGMKLSDKNVCFKNVLPKQPMFGTDNLTNDYTRPYGTANAWLSSAKDNEWIKLDFGDGKYIDEIQLVFNDDLTRDRPVLPPSTLIIDYDIIIDGKKTEVRDNIYRKKSHKIGDVVKKIEIKPLKNGGHPYFEMFGIRLY